MKKYIFIVVLLMGVCSMITMIYPDKTVYASEEQKVGNSDYGEMYIYPDTVEAVKKDKRYFVVVSAEDRYTDEKFLAHLRQGKNMENAVSTLALYMFTNDGRFYCMVQRYLIDSEGKVCVDLGSDMQFRAIDEKILTDVYTASLKVLEDKKRFQNMMGR
ncbi:hypothetical protein [Megamonas hypermegale]|uniref:hypothetical protein n=1 Tax=Megamonas hypermegale TaxID=158847 RepID=UPI0026F13D02|nr:hypothetical protein [Megamonas hypermegale]